MEKLTKEEEDEVRQKLSEMESITEGWEKNLFATAMMEAKRWGEKIDKENNLLYTRNGDYYE